MSGSYTKSSSSTLLRLLVTLTVFGGLVWPLTGGSASRDTRVQTDVVTLQLIVTDRSDHAVDELRREDVQLLEDGKPQELIHFEREVSPSRYAVVIDTSKSFERLLPQATAAIASIVARNQPTDQTSLIRFVSSETIERVCDFTSTRATVIEGLKQLRVAGGQSAIIDALYVAAESIAEHQDSPPLKHAVVLVSDGDERYSYYKMADLIERLHALNIQVFVIGMIGDLNDTTGFIKGSPRDKAEAFLKRIARETGGRVFLPRNLDALQHAADEIAHDLHSQFLIGYQCPNPRTEGFRKIQVKIAGSGKEEFMAITRSGYSVGADKPAKKKDKKKGNL
jgi:Ca-activated chloride channel family protein